MTELQAAANPAALAGENHQFLTFTLGQEEYGIEILSVQEIKGYSGLTSIPNSPPYVRGVMNLRGTVIPVVDLRIKFAMAEQDYTKFTVIIVVKVREKVIGLIVDAVSDVLDIPPDKIRETPDFGGRTDIRFIRGVATMDQKLVVLLDIATLLSDEDIPAVA